MRAALVLQHDPTAPPGLLAEWARSRGLPLDVHRTDRSPSLPDIDERAFVCCLGSEHSPLDRDVPVVAATLDLVGRAVDAGVPVLGLCYGGQVLAEVLGGTVEPAPEPELGWCTLDTDAPELVPSGPWLEWHYQRFSLPPETQELARSSAGVQAFTTGPHLGVQFHPESTIEIATHWARSDREKLERLGLTDGEERLEAGRHAADAARSNAFQLFDGFWNRARREERREP